MNKKLSIFGNWKMHQNRESIDLFVKELTNFKIPENITLGIAPQFIHIERIQNLFTEGSLRVLVGAQNCHEKDQGFFTGEISPRSLEDLSIDFILIGHSERRIIYGEDDSLLNKKIINALACHHHIIYCIGETLEEKKKFLTLKILEKQLHSGLSNLTRQNLEFLTIAYEPLWAIGTNRRSSLEDIENAHQFIKDYLKKRFSTASDKVKIFYGGSVKPNNIQELCSSSLIDGFLVGSASLRAGDFIKLCTSC